MLSLAESPLLLSLPLASLLRFLASLSPLSRLLSLFPPSSPSPISLQDAMPPSRLSAAPGHRPPHLTNIPLKFRRKSFSDPEDDLPSPDCLVPPSPSLSPSRSMSMSSSPPSSPTAVATSPARPYHLDSAKVAHPSSPIRPTAYHGSGYAYSYSRDMSHLDAHEFDFPSLERHPKLNPSRSQSYAIIPPPAPRSSRVFSASSTHRPHDGFNAEPSANSESALSHGTSTLRFVWITVSVLGVYVPRSSLSRICPLGLGVALTGRPDVDERGTAPRQTPPSSVTGDRIPHGCVGLRPGTSDRISL